MPTYATKSLSIRVGAKWTKGGSQFPFCPRLLLELSCDCIIATGFKRGKHPQNFEGFQTFGSLSESHTSIWQFEAGDIQQISNTSKSTLAAVTLFI
jgi:hypothetical protein